MIDLEAPFPEMVTLSRGGEPWARGVLRQFNGMFAVEIQDLEPDPLPDLEGMSRVVVEIARLELDERTLREYCQLGAVLPTARKVNALAAIVINGENVGNAMVGEVNGNLALSILSK